MSIEWGATPRSATPGYFSSGMKLAARNRLARNDLVVYDSRLPFNLVNASQRRLQWEGGWAGRPVSLRLVTDSGAGGFLSSGLSFDMIWLGISAEELGLGGARLATPCLHNIAARVGDGAARFQSAQHEGNL